MQDIATPTLTTAGRYVVLVCAFLGWFCAGFHLSISSLAMEPAAIDLLGRIGELDVPRYRELSKLVPKKGQPSKMSASQTVEWDAAKTKVAQWFAWLTCAFLFGAASGGLIFGRVGDRFGRSKAMALSILTYSIFSGAGSLVQTPWQLLGLWYLACTGVGGMWPNGVALVSEAWANLSRGAAAGVIGTSANIGIFLVSTLAAKITLVAKWTLWSSIDPTLLPSSWHVGADGSFLAWRWLLVVGAMPFALGVFALLFVPESPRWLASRQTPVTGQPAAASVGEVFQGTMLPVTLFGIALATIPLIGGWGSANWMVPWAREVGDAATPANGAELKAMVQQSRSFAGLVGSLIGGWIASQLGRRRTYFLASLLCLISAQYTFWFLVPTDQFFLWGVGAVGFFSGIYFGWLPLCLPELFPTRVRSTGAGVSFNFGRILTAVTVFTTGMLTTYFGGDYAKMGRVTSLCFAVGLIVIWFAPDTSQKQLED